MSTTTAEPERVRIWHTFLLHAKREARRVKELMEQPPQEVSRALSDTPVLSEVDQHTLAMCCFCVLAIEARANLLLYELEENERLSTSEAQAARRLNAYGKWFLLPRLAGRPESLVANTGSHQSIAALCKMRNELFHVKYEELAGGIPKPGTALSYYENFVRAVDAMNILLGRYDKPNQDLLRHVDPTTPDS